MTAVRLVLAALVASACAPAVVEAEPAGCDWCRGDAVAPGAAVSSTMALPCEVRAALSAALAAPLFAQPELPAPPTVAIAELLLPSVAAAPALAPVLADAPKTSPPA
jgi:hypothetical protein